MASVANAFAMSALTGPNEAYVMAHRALFGLELWDKWPPEVRRGLIGDLLDGWIEFSEADRRELDANLTVAPDQSRNEILASLLLAGKQAEPIIAALDLAPPKEAAPANPPPGAAVDAPPSSDDLAPAASPSSSSFAPAPSGPSAPSRPAKPAAPAKREKPQAARQGGVPAAGQATGQPRDRDLGR